jgi:hypothetical protein
MKTAVEWLIEQLENHNGVTRAGFEKCIQQAKAMEKEQIKDAKKIEQKNKLRHELFVGKVHEIIGFDKTVQLLKECNKTFKSE